MSKQKENKEKEVKIPIPNTRFIFTAKQKEDTSWDVSIFDPQNGTEKSCKKDVPNPVFHLLSSIALKTEVNKKKVKEKNLKETKAYINKVIKKQTKTYGQPNKRSNRKSKSPKTHRAKRLKNGINKPNISRNRKIRKRNQNN